MNLFSFSMNSPFVRVAFGYEAQSGDYAKSKYYSRCNGAKANVKRQLNKVQELKKSSKNQHKQVYKTPQKIIEAKLAKFEPHVGMTQDFHFLFINIIQNMGDIDSAFGLIFYIANMFLVNMINIIGIFLKRLNMQVDIIDMARRYVAAKRRDFNVERVLLGNYVEPISNMQTAQVGLNLWRNMSKFSADNVEKWATLVIGLMASNNLVVASSLILTHFKTYCSKSLAMELTEYFKTIISRHELEPQSTTDLIEMFRNLTKDFKSLRTSPFFIRVTDIIALIVSSGMCKAMSMDFNLAGIPIFSSNLRKRIENANIIDLSQMLLECVSYFIDVGYTCFTQRSLRPILFDSVEAMDYDKKYLDFIRAAPLVCDGDWEAAGYTYESFIELYNDIFSYMKSMHATLSHGFEKKTIWDRIVAISKIRNDFDRKHNAGSMRKAPYVICVYGPSSVGKTSIGGILNAVAVIASGGTGDQAKKITWNDGDDYFSNYKVDTETIVMDDMCNTKPAFMQSSPLGQLIKFNNNNPEYAVMADLESKGKIAIRPKTILITTNVENLLAPVFSNEPVSILRRLDIRISVKVRPEFALRNGGTGQKMLDPVKANTYVSSLSGSAALYPDMWYLTAEKCVASANPVQGGVDVAEFRVLTHGEVVLRDVSLLTLANYIAEKAKEHAQNQESLVRKQTTLHERIILCSVCNKIDISCNCWMHAMDELDQQVGDDNIDLTWVGEMENPGWLSWLPYWMHLEIVPFLRYLMTYRVYWDYFSQNLWLILYTIIAWIPYVLAYIFQCHSIISMITVSIGAAFHFVFFFIGYARLYLTFWTIRRRARNYYRDAVGTFHMLYDEAPLFRNYVDYVLPVLGWLSIFIVIKGFIKLCKSLTKLGLDTQSSLEPDENEYAKRRIQPNVWSSLPKKRLHEVSKASETTTWKDLNELVKKNLVHVTAGTKVVDGFYMCTNILLLPAHFVRGDMQLKIVPRLIVGNNRHTYTVRISDTMAYYFPGTDLCAVYAVGGCEKRDFRSFLPKTPITEPCVASFNYRNSDGALLSDRVSMRFGQVVTIKDEYYGAQYTFSELSTFKGMCMGIFVSETKKPIIAGFHLAGATGTPRGVSGLLTLSQFEEAFTHLSRLPGALILAEKTDVPVVMYEEHLGEGSSLMLDLPIAPRCSTNFLPEDASIMVMGACRGAVTNRSSVIVSHISQSVEEHLGFSREFGLPPMGPPIVPSWHNWSLGMQGFSTPAVGPYPHLLRLAVSDYLKGLKMNFKVVRPLNMTEIVNGLDGDKFLNRMPLNTSVGFPLGGKLIKYVNLLPPVEGHAVNYALDDAILKVYEGYKERYRKGLRCYPIFRASLKDEPVKIGKMKVRVFQAAPIALKMILREYFLPIAAHLSMHPLQSECAVGINAFSAEWDEMVKHLVEHGANNMVAGDYSAYDQRMPSSLTTAAFDILINCAERAFYSEDDLLIMRAVVADVIFPMIAYNGTLVQLCGSNPSGHNLTVYVNSIVNSLISRCAFYNIYPNKDFKSSVSLMTYGDDDIGSVRFDCRGFNNVSKSAYISSIGMKYTPPSKEGNHVEYMHFDEIDFLKRKNVYNPDLGHNVGVLELSSIMKSLHVRMRSTEITDEEWAGQVVDGALREMAPRGAQFYESMRSKLRKVAEDCDFVPHSINLSCSYDDMIGKISS
nr:MAG: structural polyprotein [Skomarfal virus 11]